MLGFSSEARLAVRERRRDEKEDAAAREEHPASSPERQRLRGDCVGRGAGWEEGASG